MADLHRLLDVQDRDLALDQLRHRRETLPDRTALAGHQQTMARLDRELAALAEQLTELTRAQKKLEDEIAIVDTKAASETKKLNSGTVTAPREIQSLSDEIDALARRKRSLEDDELELMEQAEPLTADVVRLRAERDAAVAEVPAALVERYEKLRAKLGGIAVARLDGDRCLGCHVSLPAMEVDAIRHAPEGTVVTHEECGRILVR